MKSFCPLFSKSGGVKGQSPLWDVKGQSPLTDKNSNQNFALKTLKWMTLGLKCFS